MAGRLGDLGAILISAGEPQADASWSALQAAFPKAVRVDGLPASWRTIRRTSSRNGTGARICSPTTVCVLTSSNSSLVRCPGLFKIASGTAIFPTSWRIAPRRRSRTSVMVIPSFTPTCTAKSAIERA